MKISQFKRIVNETLQRKVPVDLDDLPDVDLNDYFDEDFTEDEARGAAEDCVSEMLYELGWNDKD